MDNTLITKDKDGRPTGKICDLAGAIPSYEKAEVSGEPREGVGTKNPPEHEGRQVMARWEVSSGFAASLAKIDYLKAGPTVWQVSPFWSETFGQTEESERGEGEAAVRKEKLSLLYDGIDEHYSTVIARFDVAVAQLTVAGGQDPHYIPPPSPPANTRKRRYEEEGPTTGTKRDIEDDEEEEEEEDEDKPMVKRQNTSRALSN
ncbi:hypothetical protein DFP72DRAFT_843163 [Ephemerocybe angulata]|uniref:Uncharacterized protein n=1 Tax=Ephemerocybe angulata TaxID=980116 RepID=A0A8H6MEC8_9AGAR|nr:hypothetical protein DFP72DRAFT_843163 [Tulosesus angulatus]